MDNQTAKAKIREAVDHFMGKARRIWAQDFPDPRVRFDGRGRAAGQANAGGWWVRFNVKMLADNGDAAIRETVGHEIAHLIADFIHGKRCVHNAQWKAVMKRLGLRPERCHNYDTSGVKMRRQRRWRYVCDCRIHAVSTTQHNKVRRQSFLTLRCTECGSTLQFTGRQITQNEIQDLANA